MNINVQYAHAVIKEVLRAGLSARYHRGEVRGPVASHRLRDRCTAPRSNRCYGGWYKAGGQEFPRNNGERRVFARLKREDCRARLLGRYHPDIQRMRSIKKSTLMDHETSIAKVPVASLRWWWTSTHPLEISADRFSFLPETDFLWLEAHLACICDGTIILIESRSYWKGMKMTPQAANHPCNTVCREMRAPSDSLA
jgi:hypothetical protein